MKYKIIDIQDIKTKKTKTDDKNLSRIGSIISLYNEDVKEYEFAFLCYEKDNEGNEKKGVLRTSLIRTVSSYYDDGKKNIVIYTCNSIYFLEEVKNEDN